jgi:hypothetical protein
MKNIKFLSMVGMLAFGSLLLTNCGTGDEPDPSPVLNFLGGDYISTNTSLAANTDFTIAVTANHTKNLKTLKVVQSLDGQTDIELVDSAYNDKTIAEFVFNGTTAASAGTEIYTFIVADKDGNSTSKAITITNIGDPGNDLETFEKDNNGETFKVYNFQGPAAGAYEMAAGPLSSGDANSRKDIQDSTANVETNDWPARWTSRNGSTFKKVSSSAWSTISNDAEIAASWEAAGSEQSVLTAVKGDFYIIHAKSSNKYGLIEITDVISTPSDNLDYVEFRYKFQL